MEREHNAMFEAMLAEHYGEKNLETEKVLSQEDIIWHAHDEHLSMCLMVWRQYPLDLSDVLSQWEYVNRFLSQELKEPKDVGYPHQSMEFLLGQVVNVLVQANSTDDNVVDIVKGLITKPWERR